MSIQVVHDQHYLFRRRIPRIKQPLDVSRPVLLGPLCQGFRMTPERKRFGTHKNTAGPVTPVFSIGLFGVSRF
jgi:hypothetical protein